MPSPQLRNSLYLFNLLVKNQPKSSNTQGFALVTAIALGFLAVLIALTTIFRAQANNTTAANQQRTVKTAYISEAGLSGLLAQLKDSRYQSLLALSYDPLSPTTGKNYLGADGVPNSADETTTAVNQWNGTTLANTNPCSATNPQTSDITAVKNFPTDVNPAGQYQILAYRARDTDADGNVDTGSLLVEGRYTAAWSTDTRRSLPRARRLITFPLTTVNNQSKIPFPGLYVGGPGPTPITMGNNDLLKGALPSGQAGVNANIVCKNCQFVANNTTCTNGSPTNAALRTAVGAQSNSNIDGSISIVPSAQLNPVPTSPTTVCSATSGPNCYINLGAINNTTSLPQTVDSDNRRAWMLDANTAQWTWPADANQPYRYRVTGISLNGNRSLSINTTPLNASLPNPPNSPDLLTAPVELYVIGGATGNISMAGNARINNIDSTQVGSVGLPQRLRIYGNAIDPNDTVTDQTWTLNGGAQMSAFIYAPDATVGINGGVNDPDILGAVWSKSWDGSNSNLANIRVPDSISSDATILSLLDPYFRSNYVQPIKTWQAVPVD